LIVETRTGRVFADRNLVEHLKYFVAILCALANVIVVDQILLHHHSQNRCKAKRISAGTNAKMIIGHLCGFGPARIDNDQ